MVMVLIIALLILLVAMLAGVPLNEIHQYLIRHGPVHAQGIFRDLDLHRPEKMLAPSNALRIVSQLNHGSQTLKDLFKLHRCLSVEQLHFSLDGRVIPVVHHGQL